ncbi:hypothetical protein JTE90_013716 [Oedothorax gibbosus]|uniref:Origin recognition complex subunit 5 n=1 Tax=Oedothorax gibbosus TaxID=931172 RepID=A0AAV6UZQ3_9ARAC|nr:hypothetical protein JTE90_013716 [Oedothorax gibbosus]
MEIDNSPGNLELQTVDQILFREKEKEFISHFMGPTKSTPYPSLFIYGHTATGKTLVVGKILQDLNVPHVWINCHESYNSLTLFTNIVQKFTSADEDVKKVSNICEFVNFLKTKLKDASETTYLVFDCAEVLRKEDPFILSVLSRLQELTRVNVCTVFISELPWVKFRSQISSFNPMLLNFPNYSKSQMSEILSCECPPDYDADFYEGYVNVIMKTFFTVTRNLAELKHLARINFEKYCEPLDEDSDGEVNSLRLWKNIEPTLKEAMGSVYLREISGSKWRTRCKSDANNQENGSNSVTPTSDKFCATRELPFYSKFLLLAAYFASYNPPKSDFKHFVKNQGKQNKKRITKKMEKNRHLLGPKPFNLDRLLSIFFSIVGERVLPSALIFSQISSLVSMRLMSRVSADEQLDCPKYKCLAELDLVNRIGKTVNIDVMGYLDDFL